MGCTPSTHLNKSGVVNCEDDDSCSSHLIGVQGSFRKKVEESESQDVQLDTLMTTFQEELYKGSVYFHNYPERKQNGNAVIKFGPMCLQIPMIKALLVFSKEDAQSDALKCAAEKLSCECTMAYSAEDAQNMYSTIYPQLVFIDSRQSQTLDAAALSRSIHNIQGSQFSCFVAVVKKSIYEREEGSIVSFLQAGFTRCFVENHNPGVCLNELIQIHHSEISYLLKLKASEALFTALESCREGIIITNLDHTIQFANKASEKLLGYTTEDLQGRNAQTLCRAESVKADIVESINMQVRKGKEWEGTLFHKRKSGESLPLWSRIQAVEIYSGQTEHLIHINETPVTEKSLTTEATDFLPFVKAPRKGSCDIRSLTGESGLNRRQSFAKFHPMTLEPPITKVINMILATQEHSPLFVVQALDRVLEILRSTDIYSPQFTGLGQNQADDQVASDLFSGLVSNNKQAIRRFSQEASRASSTGSQAPPTPSIVPSLASAPPKIKEVLTNVMEWHFDIFQLERLSEKRPLIWVGMSIFAKFNACNLLNCDESILRNWLSMVESHYHPNPYHNSTHAADVLQATAYFLEKPKLKAIFDPTDEIICLIAAAVHDIDHPGRNSAFLCNVGSDLAILYNDLCVLESHHSALCFKLTKSDDKVNIFKNLTSDSYKEIRRSIIDMVLATEMTKHFEHLSKFVNVFTKSCETEEEGAGTSEMACPDLNTMATPENIVLVKRILIKCADVSNPSRPLGSCKEWAYRIAEEYMSQTDEEKSKGLPIVMPAFDRTKCSIPKSQIGFIDYFVNDMFDAWDVFCDVPELINDIKQNYEFWNQQEALRQKELENQEVEDDT